MAEASAERFEALLTSPGRELLDQLAAAAVPGDAVPGDAVPADTPLRLGTALRARYPADLVVAALAQHELRLQARAKFSRAMEMFFTRPGLEQASSEVVARHRSGRYDTAGQVADLCCGIGGDLVTLAEDRRVLAVDHDPLHLRIARANAEVCGVGAAVTPVQSDVRDADLSGVDAIFVDPARRSGSRRLPAGRSEPPLEWCLGLAAKVGAVGIKAAPGLPHQAVPPGWELEFIAIGRALKEAVAWSPALAAGVTRATILPQGHTLVPGPGPPVQVRMPGEYLLDPNPAVTRASGVQELARRLGAWKIDDQIAFLSADVPLRTPFGRALRVIDSAPWNQKQLPARLRGLDVGAVDIRRRGLAGDVDQLHGRLRLSGSRRATLVMTRVLDRPWGLVCLDVERP
jgi:SAM-dependent methyltransferase